METKRILIVDDSALIRSHLREMLAEEPDLKIVGEAEDGLEAIEKARALGPDLVLMDIRMPFMNGIEAVRQLKKEMPETKAIILTIHDLLEYRKAAKKSGADGFVLKVSIDKELIPTIRDIFDPNKKNENESIF